MSQSFFDSKKKCLLLGRSDVIFLILFGFLPEMEASSSEEKIIGCLVAVENEESSSSLLGSSSHVEAGELGVVGGRDCDKALGKTETACEAPSTRAFTAATALR